MCISPYSEIRTYTETFLGWLPKTNLMEGQVARREPVPVTISPQPNANRNRTKTEKILKFQFHSSSIRVAPLCRRRGRDGGSHTDPGIFRETATLDASLVGRAAGQGRLACGLDRRRFVGCDGCFGILFRVAVESWGGRGWLHSGTQGNSMKLTDVLTPVDMSLQRPLLEGSLNYWYRPTTAFPYRL